METAALIDLAYLAAAVLFIYGLKGLTHPRTAVRGNLLAASGMLVATVVTFWNQDIVGFKTIAAGIAVGTAIGATFAIRVEMTSMPQLVALFNGFGGGASVLVAGAALSGARAVPAASEIVAVAASGFIGAVTLTGSTVAFGKLQGLVNEKSLLIPNRHLVNGGLSAVCLALAYWQFASPPGVGIYWLLVLVACGLGVLLVIPIGGADMPVVIALLNSMSGLAAAATGFVLHNNVLIVSGSLVGASGLILTAIMCKAMNRSLTDVLFGVLEVAEGPSADEVYAGKIKATSADELAMLMDGAQRVVIVPGYGMAVAQAQHVVRELSQQLEDRGTTVEFAIHPVAGRMPGHMNVLLAEAEVPYEKLVEMDTVNPSFPQTDVAIVIGANDVVNPVARDENSAIAGMPILNVDEARTVVVVKRSLSPGFAGIPNPLFALDHTLMFFSDGKQAMQELVEAIKENA